MFNIGDYVTPNMILHIGIEGLSSLCPGFILRVSRHGDRLGARDTIYVTGVSIKFPERMREVHLYADTLDYHGSDPTLNPNLPDWF